MAELQTTYSNTIAHIATGWIADETVTEGICRIVKR
jgi:hypothetical protein